MYSTFFGECSSLKKRSYLRQWDFKYNKKKIKICNQICLCNHTCINRSTNSCPVIENFIWIEEVTVFKNHFFFVRKVSFDCILILTFCHCASLLACTVKTWLCWVIKVTIPKSCVTPFFSEIKLGSLYVLKA
jgi:hypothetical protein